MRTVFKIFKSACALFSRIFKSACALWKNFQNESASNRKFALVGIIPNQLFSFSSDKDRRTAQWLERATRIRKILGSIPGGAALCFFRLIRLSVLLSLSELKEKS